VQLPFPFPPGSWMQARLDIHQAAEGRCANGAYPAYSGRFSVS
jgi:hypothetical protein